MATSIIPNPNVIRETLTIEVANSSVISKVGGDAYGYRYGDKMICYMSFGFKTTALRSADLGVFRLRTSNNKIVMPTAPYFIPCMVNSDSVMRWSFRDDIDAWWKSPVTWNANAEFRISGVFIGDIQS